MAQLTFVNRLSDGLPLAAANDAYTLYDIEKYRAQARAIIKSLDSRAPSCMSIDADGFVFYYIIDEGIVYLTLVDAGYPKKLALRYLHDVHTALVAELKMQWPSTWQHELRIISNAYALQKFEKTLTQLRREYSDPTSRSNSSRLTEELSEVHSIMKRNIQEVLDRGEKLDYVSRVSTRLADDSKHMKWGAKRLNLLDMWRTYGPFAILALFVLFILVWRFFL